MLWHELREKKKAISESASDLTNIINVVMLNAVPDSRDPLQEVRVHVNAAGLKACNDLRYVNCCFT